MNLTSLIQAVSNKNILTKNVQQEVIQALERLNSYGFDNTKDNTKNLPTYLNRAMQNRITKLRAFAVDANAEARELDKLGFERIAEHVRVGVRFLSVAVSEVLDALGGRERAAVERSYQNVNVSLEARDLYRFNPDRQDDEKALVSNEALYDFAQMAMIGCNQGCNGKKSECYIRDLMIDLRIPPNENVECCPYWLPKANNRKAV